MYCEIRNPQTDIEALAYHELQIQMGKRCINPLPAEEGVLVYYLSREEIKDVLVGLRPKVQEIIDRPGSQWEGGPAAVWVAVWDRHHDGMDLIETQYGQKYTEYPDHWDEFDRFAINKCLDSVESVLPSEECPVNAVIKHNTEDRNWMGGDVRGPFGVGSSGLNEEADKEVTELILHALTEATAEKQISKAA
jgi:hypothetical protein